MRKKTVVATGVGLILAAGLFLPRIASCIQDNRDADAVGRYEVQDISLSQMLPWSFNERLQYASLSMSSIRAEQGKEMDPASVEEAIQNILKELEQSGAITSAEKGWTLKQAEPTIIAARTEILVEDARQLTLYFGWLCRVFDEVGNQVSMLVDDETGKLLAALYEGKDREKQPAITEEMGMEAALRWAEFCERSYGYTFQSILPREGFTKGWLNFKLLFTTDSEETVELTCAAGPGGFKFQEIISF